MEILPTEFEQTILWVIFWSAIFLAAISVSIMLFLIIRKCFRNHAAAKRKERTEKISLLFYKLMNDKSMPLNVLDAFSSFKDKSIICEIALTILRTIRGDDHLRLLQMLEYNHSIEYLELILKKGSRGKKIQTLSLLAYFNDEKTLYLLQHHAKEKDIYVQLAALHGLAKRNVISYLPEIIEILISAKNHNTPMLADILVKFGETAVPELIALALREDVIIEVRIAAINALEKIGSLKAVDALIVLAENIEPDIRANSIAALEKLGDPRSCLTIIARLKDRHVRVRLQAAKAAGSLKLQEAILSLTDLLHDNDWWTSYCAAEALFKLGNRGLLMLQTFVGKGGRAADIVEQFFAEKESERV